MMFKVLLVDDEVFVRKGLLEIIPWEALNFSIAGEANNGAEALDMIRQLKPDLVITDIRMPILDGLELISSVAENNAQDVVFIVISGFNDFKYAQQALRYGVHDYILKPIDDEEMTATLRKLSYTMGRKRITTLTNDDHTASVILEALVQGKLPDTEAEPLAAALGMEHKRGFLYCLAEVYSDPEDQQLTLKQFQSGLQFIEEDGNRIPVFEQQQGSFGMLLCTEAVTGGACGLANRLECFRSALADRLGCRLSLYAGDPAQALIDVHRSYAEANEAARHKYAEPAGLIMYSLIKERPLYVFDMSPAVISKLIVQLEEGDRCGYLDTVDSIFQLFHKQRFTPQAVSGSLARCRTGIIAVIKEMDGSKEQILKLRGLTEREHVNWSLQMLKENFTLAMQEAAEYIALLRKEHSAGGIVLVKRYIDTRYRENISLKSIAAQFYMNAVYLGRLFRKTYGVYFNDYLLELRIQEAKKLLRKSDFRIYEIAEKVGFQSADYFVTQFEKLEQVSPTEYRNMLIEKE